VFLSAALSGSALAAGNVEDTVQPGDPAAMMVASDRGAEWRSLSVADALRNVPVARGGSGAVRPAPGPISTPFHEPGALWRLGYHPGLDIAAVTGTPIVAAFDGTVVEAEFDQIKGYGNYVKLDHGNGMITLYGHMSQIGAKVGDHVTAGTVIGLVGSTGFSTGPHLHWEVRINGELQDPATYLR
jgi:murein DD-endopeptidase MepM/ murein hydrolase activator NlpD